MMDEPITDVEILKRVKVVTDYLEAQGIEYEYHTHDELHTIAECEALPFVEQGMLYFKNLFLCNPQGSQHYLLLLRGDKKFVTKDVSRSLEVPRLSFGSFEKMYELLGLEPGAVSPFGLINDKNKQVTLVLDSDIMKGKKLLFHPNYNGATVLISREGFLKYIRSLGVSPKKIKVD